MLTPSLFLLVLAVLALLAAGWRWSSRPPSEHVACAVCGHDIREATDARCPECGADLHEVGVLTPAMRRTARLRCRAAVMAMGVLAGALAAALGIVLLVDAVRADGLQHEERLTLGSPRSGAFARFALEGVETVRDERRRFRSYCLHIEWADGRRSAPLCVEPPPRPVRSTTPDSLGEPVIPTELLLLDDVLDWGRRIGLDPADPDLRQELTDIHRVATTSLRTEGTVGIPTPGFGGRVRVSTQVRPVAATPAIVAATATGLLVLGIGWLAWRRHRWMTIDASRAAARIHVAPTTERR